MTFVYPARDFIAVGDIHGDYDLLVTLLTEVIECAEFSDDADTVTWVGGDTLVVFCGDLVDPVRPQFGSEAWNQNIHGGEYKGTLGSNVRKVLQEEFKVLKVLFDLNASAISEGTSGRVIRLLGNHEMMHFLGDTATAQKYCFEGKCGSDEGKKHLLMKERMDRFKEGGMYWGLLRNTDSADDPEHDDEAYKFMCCVQIGDWVLCHGGISKRLVDGIRLHGSEKMIVKQTFDEVHHVIAYLNEQADLAITTATMIGKDKLDDHLHFMFSRSSSVVWNRQWSHTDRGSAPCEELDLMFPDAKETKSLKMIVGHTTQNYKRFQGGPVFSPSKVLDLGVKFMVMGDLTDVNNLNRTTSSVSTGINAGCDGRVWRVDVAMSQAFHHPTDFENAGVVGSRFPQALFVTKSGSMSVLLGKTSPGQNATRNPLTSQLFAQSLEQHVQGIRDAIN